MKKFAKSLFLAMMAVCTAMSLAACGDNDDPDDPTQVANYTVEYDVELSQAYIDFFDVEVSYTDKDGKTVARPMGAREFQVIESFKGDKLLDSYDLTVKITAKKALPAIDANRSYRFEKEYEIDLEKNGNTVNQDGSESAMSIAGKDLQRYIG